MRYLVFLTAIALVISPPVLACYGAQAIGMGGAYSAVAEGVLAIYWNQAGLALGDTSFETSATFTTPEDNINYNSFSGIMGQLGPWAVGAGITRLAAWQGNETWTTLALGYRINDHLAIGGGYRVVDGENSAWSSPYPSTGLDLSVQYRKDMFRFGLLAQDLGGPNETNFYTENIRPSIALETDHLTLALDIYLANNLDDVFSGQAKAYNHQAGFEYRPGGRQGGVALRGGFYHGVVTAGAGVQFEHLFSDIVYTPQWDVLQITGGIRF